MFDLAPYFSSEAKFKVLRVLTQHDAPIPLRHISYLAEIPIFSVERALLAFLKGKLVTKRKLGRNRVYELLRSHPMTSLISKIFRLLHEEGQKQEAMEISKKAPHVLAFASDAQAMIRTAKLKR